MTTDEMIALAKQAAEKYGLDPALVCAVVEQESGWNPWAIRHEPAFFKTYIVRLINEGKLTSDTEEVARSFSWGLMQIMGEVAREHGYTGHMAALCDPPVGLQWGCLHLLSKVNGASGDLTAALLAWNGGADKAYPGMVLARMVKYK